MSSPEPGASGGPGSGPTLIDGVDVDAVAAAVRLCAAVDDLYSSPAAMVASYLPGRQVPGIRVGSDTVTVQVRSRWSIPVSYLADQVHDALRGLVGGRRIDVVVADIADPPRTAPPALPAAGDTALVAAAPDTVLSTPVRNPGVPPEPSSGPTEAHGPDLKREMT